MSDFFEPTGGLDHFREEEREQTERDELEHDRELDQRYDHADTHWSFAWLDDQWSPRAR